MQVVSKDSQIKQLKRTAEISVVDSNKHFSMRIKDGERLLHSSSLLWSNDQDQEVCSRVLELDLPVVETTVASVEVLFLKCSRKLNEVLAAGVLLEEIIDIFWVSSSVHKCVKSVHLKLR